MLSVSEQRDIHGYAAALSNAKLNKPMHTTFALISPWHQNEANSHTTIALLRLFTLRFSHFFSSAFDGNVCVLALGFMSFVIESRAFSHFPRI